LAEYPRLSKAVYLLLVALFLFSFVSKAGINIFSGLAYLCSVVLLWRLGLRSLRDYPWWVLFLIPVLIGIPLSALTEAGGIYEIGQYLTRFKFFILPIAIILVARNKNASMGLLVAVWVSALIATLYGFSQSEQRVLGGFEGFHFILRNADMLVIVILTLIVFLFDEHFRQQYGNWFWVLFLSLLLLSAGLLMSAARGAWLGCFLGMVVFSLLFYRRFLIIIAIAIVASLFFLGESEFIHEAKSIFDFSANFSNNARLQLWQAGWDFSQKQFWFGAGYSQVEPLFLDHFFSQSVSYQQQYALAVLFPWDFHNSYLQILVEWGAVFFGIFMLCGAVLLVNLYRSIHRTMKENCAVVKAAVVVSFGYLPIQFFHNELYGYGTVIYLLLLTVALSAKTWQSSEQSLQSSEVDAA